MTCKACIYDKLIKINSAVIGGAEFIFWDAEKHVAEFIFWDAEKHVNGEEIFDEQDAEKIIKIMNEKCSECPNAITKARG